MTSAQSLNLSELPSPFQQDRDPDSAAFVGAVGLSGEATEALSLAPDT